MTSEMHKLYHISRSNSSKERWTHLPTLHFEQESAIIFSLETIRAWFIAKVVTSGEKEVYV